MKNYIKNNNIDKKNQFNETKKKNFKYLNFYKRLKKSKDFENVIIIIIYYITTL